MNDALTNYRLSKLREGFVDRALTAAVSGAVRLPVASRDRDWDGDAARRRVLDTYDSATDRRRAFLWVDGDPELAGSYHLGYADVVDGELTIIPRGVSAARGALSGARGADLNLPAAVSARLDEIEAHVRAELDGDDPNDTPNNDGMGDA
jgi:hypothetical protein